MSSKELRVVCPSCRARLAVDARTERVVAWQPPSVDSPSRPRVTETDWRRAVERTRERLDRGSDRFEAALAKERGRERDLDDLFAERAGDDARPDPFDAALARVRGRERGADRTPVHGDEWVRRLAAVERSALSARAAGAARSEGADPAWGTELHGPAAVAVGPGYAEVFGAEDADDEQLGAVLGRALAGTGPTARLLPLAGHGATALRLLAAGWVPAELDPVFHRDLDGLPEPHPRTAGVRPVRAGDVEAWCRLLVRALGLADADRERRVRRVAAEFSDPRWRLFLSADGRDDVAAAALWLDEGVALMAMAATLPEHRGRGHHQALVDARLRAAAEAGASEAVSLPEPRGPSQSATLALGFRLAFHQSLWVPGATA